jgi:hypothetical protein
VDGTEVGVVQELDEVSLGSLLKGDHGGLLWQGLWNFFGVIYANFAVIYANISVIYANFAVIYANISVIYAKIGAISEW